MSNYLLKGLASPKWVLVSSREKQQMVDVNTLFYLHTFIRISHVIIPPISASNILQGSPIYFTDYGQ